MATTVQSKSAWLELYDGFPTQDVGAGTIDPDIYSTKGYAKKKVQKIFIGGLNKIVYAGFEHDFQPLILTIGYEAQYNTILAFNLHYVPLTHRQKVIRYILKSNRTRIRKKLPILVDYPSLIKAVPSLEGAVRRYKRQLIRVKEAVPLVGWGEVIKEPTKWRLHYRENT